MLEKVRSDSSLKLDYCINHPNDEAMLEDISERRLKNRKFLRICEEAVYQGFTLINLSPMIYARLRIIQADLCRLECFDWRSEEFAQLLKQRTVVDYYYWMADPDLYREIAKRLKNQREAFFITRKLCEELRYWSGLNPAKRSAS